MSSTTTYTVVNKKGTEQLRWLTASHRTCKHHRVTDHKLDRFPLAVVVNRLVHLIPLLKEIVDIQIHRRMVADLIVDDTVEHPQSREVKPFAHTKQVDHVARQIVEFVDIDAIASIRDNLVQVPAGIHARVLLHVVATNGKQQHIEQR